LKNLIKLAFAMILAAILFTACSEEDNPMSTELTNITGKWDGSLNHPGYDSGTLSLQILQNNDNITGDFTMRLVKNNGVQNYSGSLSGAKTGNNNYSITLTGTNFTWISDLTIQSVTLSGGWESSGNSLSGSLSVQKN
jgi:hypothetical protein